MAKLVILEKNTSREVISLPLYRSENPMEAFMNACTNLALRTWEHNYRVEGALAR